MTTTTKINGMKVACTRKVRTSKTDKVGTDVAWTFNFEDCPQEKILELATRSLVIDVQRDYRTAKPDARKALIKKEFSVKDIIQGKRKSADPVAKAKAELAKLSAEDIAEIMAQYQKES